MSRDLRSGDSVAVRGPGRCNRRERGLALAGPQAAGLHARVLTHSFALAHAGAFLASDNQTL